MKLKLQQIKYTYNENTKLSIKKGKRDISSSLYQSTVICFVGLNRKIG